jgi:hypothetical protein
MKLKLKGRRFDRIEEMWRWSKVTSCIASGH